MDLKETDILGDSINTHWYYASKAKAIRALIGGKKFSGILDVGAGSGFFSQYLLQRTPARQAWCVDTSYAAESEQIIGNKPIHYCRSIDKVDADLVLFMDVLEHVDDDVGLLREYIDRTPPGALVLITVPAFQFLWSRHDDFLEHKRRYTRAGLLDTVQRAGLESVTSCYFFGALFPLVLVRRILTNLISRGAPAQSDLKRHHPLTNGLFSLICTIERRFFTHNKFAGLSVLCLARKSGS